jgi:hypothetical protein
MNYNILTEESALDSFNSLMGYVGEEYFDKIIIRGGCDIDEFLDSHLQDIKEIDISDMSYTGIHITTSPNKCQGILENGVISLREVLKADSFLSKLLGRYGLSFDLDKDIMIYRGESYDVNYSHYDGERNSPIKEISRKLCNDPQVNGFFHIKNIENYGSNIHERPEFLYTLSRFDPRFIEAENEWKKACQAYSIQFKVSFEQIAWFTFYEQQYEFYDDEDRWRLKKRLLTYAFEEMSVFGSGLDNVHIYLNPQEKIRSEQIVSITAI